jgi:predicted flap endonuclease-1-like 5' DNA nuclease
VDIFLRYDQQPSEPTTALGRSTCKQLSECEYSRTRESYKLTAQFGVIGSDPLRARAERWLEGYEKCLDVLKEFRYQFSRRLDPVEVRRWLLHWIEAHPQYRLCNLRDAWCELEERVFGEERFVIQLLFQLVQNCRNAYLNCDCFGCDEDASIPLARVWLVKNGNGHGDECHVVVIDPYPPYRRPIQPECWPAPLGYVNVGRFIWHRWEEVCTQLSDLGVRVRRQQLQLPGTIAELERRLNCDLFVECGETRDALVYDAGPLGQRVVGFCTGAATPTEKCPEITVDCPPEARRGATIRFAARITGGDSTVTPSYNWTVNGGTIVDGQGTALIRVKAESVDAVTAAVEVRGYDPSCLTRARCTTKITNSGGGETIDDFTSIDFIGPQRNKKLHAAGINTFRDLAETPVEKLKQLFPDLGEDVLNQWKEDAKRELG